LETKTVIGIFAIIALVLTVVACKDEPSEITREFIVKMWDKDISVKDTRRFYR
jgi:hypothetical protein